MGYESMMNGATVPVCSKDFGKKKRTNRWAKLKQEKLGARREQWLSQAKNKESKDESNGRGDFIKLNLPPKDEQKQSMMNFDVESKRDESRDLGSVINYPINSGLGGKDLRKDRPGSSSGSCSSRSACFSESISEEEEEEEDDCLDDWEAVADALTEENDQKNPKLDSPVEKEVSVGSLDPIETPKMVSGVAVPKAECKHNAMPIDKASNRAWRSDDAFRPQSLPNLSKHSSICRNFPAREDRHYFRGAVNWSRSSRVNEPPSCPICCEDLDLTDSSFLPCPCGFRLCLFCHKRILEDNGRCPGCRKPYDNPVSREAGINGGGSPFWLARSSSMKTRF